MVFGEHKYVVNLDRSKIIEVINDLIDTNETYKLMAPLQRRSLWYHFRLQYLMLLGSLHKKDEKANKILAMIDTTTKKKWIDVLADFFLTPYNSLLAHHLAAKYCNLMLELFNERPVIETTGKSEDAQKVSIETSESVVIDAKPVFKEWHAIVKNDEASTFEKALVFMTTVVTMSRCKKYSWFGTSALCVMSFRSCTEALDTPSEYTQEAEEAKVTFFQYLTDLTPDMLNARKETIEGDLSEGYRALLNASVTQTKVKLDDSQPIAVPPSFSDIDAQYVSDTTITINPSLFAPVHESDQKYMLNMSNM
eukprot:2325243-Prymnesium_polylepis.1